MSEGFGPSNGQYGDNGGSNSRDPDQGDPLAFLQRRMERVEKKASEALDKFAEIKALLQTFAENTHKGMEALATLGNSTFDRLTKLEASVDSVIRQKAAKPKRKKGRKK